VLFVHKGENKMDNIPKNPFKYCTMAVLFMLLTLPGSLWAGDYFVWGRVYNAVSIDEESPLVEVPLPGVPLGDITGAGGEVGTTERNLVNVSLENAANGNILCTYLTQNNGNYSLHFSKAGTSTSVRFVVKDLVTNAQLLFSDPVTVYATPSSNIKYILVSERTEDISSENIYATGPGGADHTGIFTRVGKVELESGGNRLIDTTTGMANVDTVTSENLLIPAYQDSPFGGNLYLFGAFSAGLYGTGFSYKVKITDLSTSSSFYLDRILRKTEYAVDLAATPPTVTSLTFTVGPFNHPVTGDPCYTLTPLSTGSDVFYSFPDLLAIWPTGSLTGEFLIAIEPVDVPPGEIWADVPNFTSFKIYLNNDAPVVAIQSESGYTTPRIFNSPLVPTANDLTPIRADFFPVDYGTPPVIACDLLDMSGVVGSRYLFFKLSASHDHIRHWYFSYERNDGIGETLMGKTYDGGGIMIDYPGRDEYGVPIPDVRIFSVENLQNGFTDRYLYLDKDHLAPSGSSSLCNCAYNFWLGIQSRVTDGYHYIHNWRWDNDNHFIFLCP